MSDEIANLIGALRAGTMSLDDVAQRFRAYDWPDDPVAEVNSDLGSRDRSLDDPDPYAPGSFDDVLAAYYRHELSLEEYRVLAQAAAEAMDAEDRRRSSAGDETTASES